MQISPHWEFVADTVMGGVSTGAIATEEIDGRDATRLTGSVSPENDGGFVQMATDLRADGGAFDARGWTGLEIAVTGNGESYDLRLRTDQLSRPWQSFRTAFVATPGWQSLRLPFAGFAPHKTDIALDTARLRRLGVVAVGRAFEADVAVARLALYRDATA